MFSNRSNWIKGREISKVLLVQFYFRFIKDLSEEDSDDSSDTDNEEDEKEET